ncbi:rhomboid family intramembrane serine protease [Sphingomonas sp. R647]|uniref:rhomboid family intramembrane serine protease n=1 Tax=Sphingomonas sp. R647 TaxID=2875233 RepID=UPI001CD453EF|nr:rhomboid family intramembrane serine protease [Sphingomonas sp. R647]MCA1198157.1 rhomboid family intramembrane serine protease [Sphingomonas sp. R647]
MQGPHTELTIRSRYGWLRDLIPIYSLFQLVPNLAAIILILWLYDWQALVTKDTVLPLVVGWVLQFMARPSEMTVSHAEAAWVEAALDDQEFYEKSDTDGRWWRTGQDWWQRWPHQFVTLIPGDRVTLVAPRDVMEAIRNALELMEEQGDSWFQGDRPFALQPPEPAPLHWTAHVPAFAIGAASVLTAVWLIATRGLDGIVDWGLSAAALSQGRFETIFLHMFTHGGLLHLVMNLSVLAAIGGMLTVRLGPPPLAWLRFLLLFVFSALAGAALFLTLHPTGTVPMVGASGGIYGLVALLLRTRPEGGPVLAIRSRTIRRSGWALVKENAFLFLLLALMSWVGDATIGLAWEAHLGGFLFGLLVGPWFLPRETGAEGDGAAEPMPQSLSAAG